MESKARVRAQFLRQRRDLDPHFIYESSRRVVQFLTGLESLRIAHRIGLYASFDNEVATEEIFHWAAERRKEIFYPVIDLQTKILHFYKVTRFSSLKLNAKGIPEPMKGSRLRSLNDLEVVFVPGIVFDLKGHRLGYGAGFYDRLLSEYHGTRIGLAYEFQIVEALFPSQDDERVDLIVTEERVIKTLS